MNRTVLITGGTGYIGSHTTVEFLQKGYRVVIVDNLSNSQKEVLNNIEAITGKAPIFIKQIVLIKKLWSRYFKTIVLMA